ncbi:hypothetical protein ABW19_dt0202634 [Dactylella cylindrospora]|nr:hypothetical protein ABW19_dt0202634 [Dactylella cylindrospora]
MYIRQSKLPHLKEYKYSGEDHSLVSRYVLRPFWAQFIKLFPMNMAPNLITLTGFFFVIVNLGTLLWYNPTLDQNCPPWVYASWAIGLFLYQSFDAVDGSQARRTKQSGPLGELFDHGVDACNTTLEVVIFAGAVNLGYTWQTVLTLFASLCSFYLTTWEEYHTHTLYLGPVSGPVEGILAVILVYGITTFTGGYYWHGSMFRALGVPQFGWIPDVIYEMSFITTYLTYGAIILGFSIYQSSMNVVKARRARGLRVRPALLGLAPFFTLWILIPTWLYVQPDILHNHLIPFMFFVGASFAYQVGLIITAHLTKSRFPYFNVLIIPIFLGTMDSLGPFLVKNYGFGWPSALGEEYEIPFVFLCLGCAYGVYGSFVVDVIMNICDYLDIWCLTIKHKKTDAPNETFVAEFWSKIFDQINALSGAHQAPGTEQAPLTNGVDKKTL